MSPMWQFKTEVKGSALTLSVKNQRSPQTFSLVSKYPKHKWGSKKQQATTTISRSHLRKDGPNDSPVFKGAGRGTALTQSLQAPLSSIRVHLIEDYHCSSMKQEHYDDSFAGTFTRWPHDPQYLGIDPTSSLMAPLRYSKRESQRATHNNLNYSWGSIKFSTTKKAETGPNLNASSTPERNNRRISIWLQKELETPSEKAIREDLFASSEQADCESSHNRGADLSMKPIFEHGKGQGNPQSPIPTTACQRTEISTIIRRTETADGRSRRKRGGRCVVPKHFNISFRVGTLPRPLSKTPTGKSKLVLRDKARPLKEITLGSHPL